MDFQGLKRLLDDLYHSYDFEARVLRDPIEFPGRYSRPEDIEVAGFIASAFAYGRVGQFKPVIERVLGVMGESPASFVAGFDPSRDGPRFRGISYRFNSTDDIVCLIYGLSSVLKGFGSIENCFLSFHDGRGVLSGIRGFVDYLKGLDKTPVYGPSPGEARGFLQFIPSPEKGSPCKRMNLFLRWMVRDRDIDFGLWKGIARESLVIPLDTHIWRISRCLGLTGRRSQDWKTAVEITEGLKRLDPEDPLKYDFALCHQGIAGLCNPCGGERHRCPILHQQGP